MGMYWDALLAKLDGSLLLGVEVASQSSRGQLVDGDAIILVGNSSLP